MTRTDTITDDLRQDILSGVFPPGDRLVELQLTQRYDCGRATVRGALVELVTEGLVDREANRGATVRRTVRLCDGAAMPLMLNLARSAKFSSEELDHFREILREQGEEE